MTMSRTDILQFFSIYKGFFYIFWQNSTYYVVLCWYESIEPLVITFRQVDQKLLKKNWFCTICPGPAIYRVYSSYNYLLCKKMAKETLTKLLDFEFHTYWAGTKSYFKSLWHYTKEPISMYHLWHTNFVSVWQDERGAKNVVRGLPNLTQFTWLLCSHI